MNKQEKKIWLIDCIKFTLGQINEAPERIQNFLQARTRRRELDKVFKPVRIKYESIQYFTKLSSRKRANLVREREDLFICLPSDLKLLGIHPNLLDFVRYQLSNFGGKTVEYKVYSLSKVLDAWIKETTYAA